MSRHARRSAPPPPAVAAAVTGLAALAVGVTGAVADEARLLLLAVVLGQLVLALAVWAAAAAVATALTVGQTARHLAVPGAPASQRHPLARPLQAAPALGAVAPVVPAAGGAEAEDALPVIPVVPTRRRPAATAPPVPVPVAPEPEPAPPPAATAPSPARPAPRRAAVPALDVLGLAPARGPAYDVLLPPAPSPSLTVVGEPGPRATGSRRPRSRRPVPRAVPGAPAAQEARPRRRRAAGSGDAAVVDLRDASGG